MYMRCIKISNIEFFLLGKFNKLVIEKVFCCIIVVCYCGLNEFYGKVGLKKCIFVVF